MTLQEMQLDRGRALEYYMKWQEKKIEQANEQVTNKNIEKGDLVLLYNSRLDKTFQKKFQIKWEGPFKVVGCFANGTFQLADMDGTWHDARVNGYRLKKYLKRLMTIVKDEDCELPMAMTQMLTKEEDYGPPLVRLFETA